jgi:hypothetical protein
MNTFPVNRSLGLVFRMAMLFFLLYQLSSCAHQRKQLLEVSIEEIPKIPKWHYIFFTDQDSGKIKSDIADYSFGTGNLVLVDTTKIGVPKTVSILMGGIELKEEVKKTWSGTHNSNGKRLVSYSILIGPKKYGIDFADHESYRPFEFERTVEIQKLIDDIF